jgi:hypothetical protein
MNSAPFVEVEYDRACYRVTMPDGVVFIVSFQAWMEMLSKSGTDLPLNKNIGGSND